MAFVPIDPVFIFVMCAIFVNGGVDCDEKWAVIVYEQKDIYGYCYPERPNTFHMVTIGCAKYDNYRGHQIILGNWGIGKSHTGHPIFIHEIMHLQCLCNFHTPIPEEPRR